MAWSIRLVRDFWRGGISRNVSKIWWIGFRCWQFECFLDKFGKHLGGFSEISIRWFQKCAPDETAAIWAIQSTAMRPCSTGNDRNYNSYKTMLNISLIDTNFLGTSVFHIDNCLKTFRHMSYKSFSTKQLVSFNRLVNKLNMGEQFRTPAFNFSNVYLNAPYLVNKGQWEQRERTSVLQWTKKWI